MTLPFIQQLYKTTTKTRPSWEKDTPNPKRRGRPRETIPAKIFPRHDMSKGKTSSVLSLPWWQIIVDGWWMYKNTELSAGFDIKCWSTAYLTNERNFNVKFAPLTHNCHLGSPFASCHGKPLKVFTNVNTALRQIYLIAAFSFSSS